MAEEESREDYSSEAYWDRRYASGERSGHEWYFDYETLAPLLHILLPEAPRGEEAGWSALEIGCGDVPLAPDLAEDTHFADAEVFAVDFSGSVVRSMRQRERDRCSLPRRRTRRVTYEVQDARALTYGDGHFDLVLDKGTIDAMLCSDAEGYDNARQICAEATRVLRVGGCFVVISHMNPAGEAGAAFLSRALLPGLEACTHTAALSIGVHYDEEAEEDGPFVYAVSKAPRPHTRAAGRGEAGGEVPLHLHAH